MSRFWRLRLALLGLVAWWEGGVDWWEGGVAWADEGALAQENEGVNSQQFLERLMLERRRRRSR